MPKTPQEIVNAAYAYMTNVMSLQASKIANPRVEELVPAKDGEADVWKVVISYDIIGDFAFDKTREYKEFIVDEEAKVLEMRIRKV